MIIKLQDDVGAYILIHSWAEILELVFSLVGQELYLVWCRCQAKPYELAVL